MLDQLTSKNGDHDSDNLGAEKNQENNGNNGKSKSDVNIKYYDDNFKNGDDYKKNDTKNNDKKQNKYDKNNVNDGKKNIDKNKDLNKNSRYDGNVNKYIKNNEEISINSEDLNERAIETTVIILDHINDSKRYFDFLKRFAFKLNLKCIIFYDKNFEKRMKNIIIIIQSYNSNKDFITLLKTEYVDVNMKKQPCKERCSSTIFNSKKNPNFFIENNEIENNQDLGTFLLIDCDNKQTIQLFREKYKIPEISDSISNFCFKNR